jgi:hypothetical protein
VDEDERVPVSGLDYAHGKRRVSQPYAPAPSLHPARLEQPLFGPLEGGRAVTASLRSQRTSITVAAPG